MRRRQLLAGLAAVGALGAAGCTTRRRRGAPPDETPTSDPTTGEPTTGDPTTDDGDGPTGEPVETAVVGDREGVAFPENNEPHELRVYNDAPTRRSIGIVVRADDPVLERTVDVPADGWVRIRLLEPAAYAVVVTVDGQQSSTVPIRRELFDCNSSRTTVAVDRAGAVTARTVSDGAGCPRATVTGTGFEDRGGDCGTGDRATVAFVDERVRIDGAVEVPTPCHRVELASTDLSDREDGDGAGSGQRTLTVVVAEGEEEGDGCTACVGLRSYRASVAFDDAYPATVRVVHDGSRGQRTVTTVSPIP